MRFQLLVLLPLAGYAAAQAAGGAVESSAATSQYPTTTWDPIVTVLDSGETSTTWILVTNTFATTALGSWAFATPSPGSIGLGTYGSAATTSTVSS